MKTKTLIIAHRGRTSGKYRDNTLEAFEHAIAVGVDMLEFDVRRTMDAKLIIFHDRSIRGKRLSKLTYDQIKTTLGFTPPLLSDVLALGSRVKLDIELKEDGYVEDIIKLIKQACSSDQIIITSFQPGILSQVKDYAPKYDTGLVVANGLGSIKRAHSCRADYLVLHYFWIKLGMLQLAAKAGLPCLVWATNNPQVIHRQLSDPRIIGLITDVPEQAIAVAKRSA